MNCSISRGTRCAWPLLVTALVALAAAPEAEAVGGELNGLTAPPVGATLGSLDLVPDGCVVEFAVTIVTTHGGGQDLFELQVADDGRILQTVPLSAPADGLTHQLFGEFRLTRPPSSRTAGIGVYLVDDGTILDAVDPLGVPCSIAEVPTLAGKGYVALGGVLALAALVSLRRPRRA